MRVNLERNAPAETQRAAAIPSGKGICNLGPWLEPTFTLRQFPVTGASRFEVVKAMYHGFDYVSGLAGARRSTCCSCRAHRMDT